MSNVSINVNDVLEMATELKQISERIQTNVDLVTTLSAKINSNEWVGDQGNQYAEKLEAFKSKYLEDAVHMISSTGNELKNTAETVARDQEKISYRIRNLGQISATKGATSGWVHGNKAVWDDANNLDWSDKQGEWYRVKRNGEYIGWVHEDNVEVSGGNVEQKQEYNGVADLNKEYYEELNNSNPTPHEEMQKQHGTHPEQISNNNLSGNNTDTSVNVKGNNFSLKDAVENKQDINLNGADTLVQNDASRFNGKKIPGDATSLKYNAETGLYDAYAGDKKVPGITNTSFSPEELKNSTVSAPETMNVSISSLAEPNSNVISVKGIDSMKQGWINHDISGIDHFKLDTSTGNYKPYNANNEALAGVYSPEMLDNLYVSVDNPFGSADSSGGGHIR